MTSRSAALHIKGLCADFACLYTVNFSIVAMLFQANLSPNKLSRRVFLEQKKANTFVSLSQPTSVYCRNSTGISDTEEGWLCKEEGRKKEAAVRAVSEISNKLCSTEGNCKA